MGTCYLAFKKALAKKLVNRCIATAENTKIKQQNTDHNPLTGEDMSGKRNAHREL
jgi:hypothetical protein